MEVSSLNSLQNFLGNLRPSKYIIRFIEILAKHNSPSTWDEIPDRRRMLKSMYSSKHSAPAASDKYPAIKPVFFPLIPLKLSEKRPTHGICLFEIF